MVRLAPRAALYGASGNNPSNAPKKVRDQQGRTWQRDSAGTYRPNGRHPQSLTALGAAVGDLVEVQG
ncbi:hypothetical protein [Actinopolyspora halophila]|uniref:hypothetical protein n=1 Tax=Actinopolyspora halophila TaxID=1850 RepID=UPI00035D6AB6|nr:hypothetical protein [Actinopolyspora halophila]